MFGGDPWSFIRANNIGWSMSIYIYIYLFVFEISVLKCNNDGLDLSSRILHWSEAFLIVV